MVRAVWLYSFRDPGWSTQDAVTRVSKLGLNRVFLSLGQTLDHERLDPFDPNADNNYIGQVVGFVQAASNAGIDIHAMTLESPQFTLDAKHASAVQNHVQHILNYNEAQATAATMLKGIHIDTETASTGGEHVWDGVDDSSLDLLLDQYLGLLQAIRIAITTSSQNLEFSALLPWWFNAPAHANTLPHGNATLLARSLDVLVLQDYGGSDGRTTHLDPFGEATYTVAKAPTIIGIGSNYPSSADLVNAENILDAKPWVLPVNYRGTSIFDYEHLPAAPGPAAPSNLVVR
jgi:hypothetical protein